MLTVNEVEDTIARLKKEKEVLDDIIVKFMLLQNLRKPDRRGRPPGSKNKKHNKKAAPAA